MPAQPVVSMLVDLIESTRAGLGMHELQFREFNRALIRYIWPLVKEFGLEDSTIKFTGDGWLLFNQHPERIHAIVALAKTMAATFQTDLAANLQRATETIPALRQL